MTRVLRATFGRFQPFTKGHETIVRKMICDRQEDDDFHVCLSSSCSKDNIFNPFSVDDRKMLIKSVMHYTLDFKDDYDVIEYTNMYDFLKYSCSQYDKLIVYCGSDRAKEYVRKSKEFTNIEIVVCGKERGEDNHVSGTVARNSIANRDKDTFMSCMSEGLPSHFYSFFYYYFMIDNK